MTHGKDQKDKQRSIKQYIESKRLSYTIYYIYILDSYLTIILYRYVKNKIFSSRF
jgi:hypothetical protein